MLWRNVNGKARYFIYSLNDNEIAPGEGEILTLHFTTSSDTPEGGYDMNITDISLGVSNLIDKYSGTDQQFSFNVIGGIFGDVNCDGHVTTADITALYNYILSGDMTYFATSDVDGDGHITSADITVIYNILLGN